MTTLMFHKRFAEPIQAGTKRQTIRPARKRPINVGDSLSLRIWEGQGYRSSQITILDTKCTATFHVRIGPEGVSIGDGWPTGSLEEMDVFARSDGFKSFADMLAWYRSDGYGLPFSGVLIQWGK